MRRALGPILLFLLIALPAVLSPALGWKPDAAEPTEAPVSTSYDMDYFAYDGAPALNDLAADSSFEPSGAPQRLYVLTSGMSSSDEAVTQATVVHAEPGHRVRAVIDEEPAGSAPVEQPVETTVPLEALVVLEAQRTLVVVGLTVYPGISATPLRVESLIQPSHLFPASAADHAVQEGVPPWLWQVTWILTLVAIGLAFRPPIVAAALALFSRFSQSNVLDHERRGRLFAAIQADPGASFGELCQRAGLAAGVAQHHLRLLEQHELVRRVRDGRTTRFYPRGPRIESAALRSPTRTRLVDVVREEPQIDAKRLAERLGQRPQSTWHHLRILSDAGILTPTRRGRAIQWDVASR